MLLSFALHTNKSLIKLLKDLKEKKGVILSDTNLYATN